MAGIPEEYKGLIATLEKMKLTPKADNPEDLQSWIAEYAKEQDTTVKKESSYIPTTTVTTQPPRINNFSGSPDKKGKETTYQLWKYEVNGMIRDHIHSEEVIVQAIRRSLRGDAGLVAMRLGPDASLQHIMDKMESVYGIVEDNETIMSEFYNAKQKEDEDIATWSCRLEAILDKAIQSKKVESYQADTMLHDMLWKGLKPALKDVSHYEKEQHTSFDAFKISLRRLEKEYQLDHPTRKATVKQAVPTDTSDESELTGVLKQMNSRLENLEADRQNRYRGPYQRQTTQVPQQQQRGNYTDRGRGRGYFRPQQGGRGYGQGGRGYYDQRGRGYYDQGGRGYNQQEDGGYNLSRPHSTSNYSVIYCRRCGQEGHLARGCVKNVDVHGKPLNCKQSSTRGGR